MVPLLLRYLNFPLRQGWHWIAGFGSALGLGLFPLLQGSDWLSLLGPYRFQLLRPAEIGWTIYGMVVHEILAQGALGSSFRFGTMGLFLLILCWRPILSLTDLLVRSAILILVLTLIQVFYSPQFFLWTLPFLVPLARNNRWLTALIVGLDLTTYTTLPLWYIGKALVISAEQSATWMSFLDFARVVLVLARISVVVMMLGILAIRRQSGVNFQMEQADKTPQFPSLG